MDKIGWELRRFGFEIIHDGSKALWNPDEETLENAGTWEEKSAKNIKHIKHNDKSIKI